MVFRRTGKSRKRSALPFPQQTHVAVCLIRFHFFPFLCIMPQTDPNYKLGILYPRTCHFMLFLAWRDQRQSGWDAAMAMALPLRCATIMDLFSNRHTKSERAWSCNPDDLACLWGQGNLVRNRGVYIRNKQALAKITFIVTWDNPGKGLSLHPFLWVCVLLVPGRLGLPSAYIYIFIGPFITGLPKHFTHLHLDSLL